MKLCYIILLFVCLDAASAIYISEVMYNPEDGNEWIELYTNESYNMSGLELSDNLNTDQIICCGNAACEYIIQENTHIIIADQDSTLNFSAVMLCVDDNSIGNGLGNSADEIRIKKENSTIDNMSYSAETGKGKSLSLIGSAWIETEPTPGAENIFYHEPVREIPDIVLSLLLPEDIFTNINYRLFMLENTDYPEFSEQINATLYYNISKNSTIIYEETKETDFKSYTTTAAEFVFGSFGSYDVCGKIVDMSANDTNSSNNGLCSRITVSPSEEADCNITLELETDKQVYDEGESIGIAHRVSNRTFPFEIEYWVEDVFGDAVKQRAITSNTNRKSYTPKISGAEKAFIINSNLTKVACSNINNNTFSQKLVVFRADAEESRLTDSIAISEIPPGAAFGDIVKIKLDITKGDTLKNAVKLYVKGENTVSEVSSMNLYGSNQKYAVTVPILLKDNCNRKYNEGSYDLIAEGIGLNASEKIDISHNPSCPEEIKEKKEKEETETAGPREPEEISEKLFQNKAAGSVVYESSAGRIKAYSKYFIVLAAVIAAYLLLVRLRRH